MLPKDQTHGYFSSWENFAKAWNTGQLSSGDQVQICAQAGVDLAHAKKDPGLLKKWFASFSAQESR
jgi:hypothetical protein